MYRTRMNRSHSRGRLIETAFVSRTPSSTEDLDEVDRLANHPVLRPSPVDNWSLTSDNGSSRLRKSRSETGGSVGHGLVAWTGSNHSSPVGVASTIAGFGSRTVGVGMLTGPKRRSHHHGYVSKMKRSTTVDFAAVQADNNNLATPAHESRPTSRPHTPRCSQLVMAVIETRECITPPPNHHLVSSNSSSSSRGVVQSSMPTQSEVIVADSTPPNTAPLPVKFNATRSIFSRAPAASPPQNLLRLQQKQIADSVEGDSSSVASNTASPLPPTTVQPSPPPPKFRLPLSLANRFRLDSASKKNNSANQEDSNSSSADSTPQKKKTSSSVRGRLLLNNPLTHAPDSGGRPLSSSLAGNAENNNACYDMADTIEKCPDQEDLLKNQEASADDQLRSSSCRPKKISSLFLSHKAGPTRKKVNVNFGGESESSVMSSLESIRSTDSDGVQSLVSSGESGAGCSVSSSQSYYSDVSMGHNNSSSKPTLELRSHRANILSSSKFQVLSPISDKSQEQSSEQGDHGSQNRTPKVSPTEHILGSCCGTAVADDNENNNAVGDDAAAVPAPFAMPKLQRRLQQRRQQQLTLTDNFFRGSASSGIQGSDSGISMSSQIQDQDMAELLQLPFDMPKLRRRKQQFFSRPHSVPNSSQEASAPGSRARPSLVMDDQYCSSSSSIQSCQMPLAWPGPKPDTVHGSTIRCNYNYNQNNVKLSNLPYPDNNYGAQDGDSNVQIQQQQEEESSFPAPNNNVNHHRKMALNVPKNRLSLPECQAPNDNNTEIPPPSGFEDDTEEQFYLQEENLPQTQNTELFRRRRANMTLSFGIDPTQKTLMFATNSPFWLNDCQAIDPCLPLERQDWYHGSIGRNEAEDILRTEVEGCYLVRNVDPSRQEFALSLKSARGFMHMRIKRDAVTRDFKLSDFQRRFLTIPEMVHHYTRNRLPIKGAEHMCLKKPIAIQLL